MQLAGHRSMFSINKGMKRAIYHIFFFFATALLTCGCIQDIFINPFIIDGNGEMVDCVLDFGSPEGAEITVSTKGDLGVMRESNIFNIYLYIFNSDNKKIYGHYFTGDNLNDTASPNYWVVNNMTSNNGSPSSGTLHFRATQGTGCKIVAIANLNPNDLDVSSAMLASISTYSDLQTIIATQIRSEVTSNSGYFLMTGEMSGVTITKGDSPCIVNTAQNPLILERIYAKVTFNIRIKEGAPISSFVPDKWQVVNVPACSYLLKRNTDAADNDSNLFFTTEAVSFEKETLTSSPTDLYAGTDIRVSTHSFTFYMMENRKNPKSSPPGGWTGDKYKYREEQNKDQNGLNGTFKYANDYSTYVILTGKIVMDNVTIRPGTPTENNNAALEATVKYKIHLGNFSIYDAQNPGSYDNFNTERNKNYVYNIYINGVNDIQVEGKGGAENEPGATGTVIVAEDTVYTSDCHYSTQVVSFHAKYLTDLENITWYVETPFNRDGASPKDHQLSAIDYKWIEFIKNEKDAAGLYNERRVLYKPYDWPGYSDPYYTEHPYEKTLYVNELVDYLKAQKVLYNTEIVGYEPGGTWTNSFERPEDTSDPAGPKISFTAFVNEFYYMEDPINHGGFDPSLWKNYIVNQPMRKMHIMASTSTSADGESKVVGSSLTIQQRSIQSIYAIHERADLESAWGMEFLDDLYDETGGDEVNNKIKYWKDWENPPFEDCGNTSPTNGRLNTMRLWGVLPPDSYVPYQNLPRWDEYLNLHAANETAQLWKASDHEPDPVTGGDKDYYYLRYSCMSRNRDNDGDGYIDPEEIHWYMASDIQLIGVFLGSYGIEGAAHLYQRTADDQLKAGNTNAWRQHVVASNRYNFPSPPGDARNSNKYARVIWAEEGINGTNISYSGNDQTKSFSTRCVRNLGYYNNAGVRTDISEASPDIEPDLYLTVTRKHLDPSDLKTVTSYPVAAGNNFDDYTFYTFDCSRINLASLREPIDHELVGHDEFSRMACLSSGFETAPKIMAVNLDNTEGKNHSFNGTTYDLTRIDKLYDYLDSSFGNLDADFSVCPKGYRLPNVRELSVMWNIISNFIPNDKNYLGGNNDNVPARTYWSMGKKGSNTKVNNVYGWSMIPNKLQMTNTGHKISKPRCVKDVY